MSPGIWDGVVDGHELNSASYRFAFRRVLLENRRYVVTYDLVVAQRAKKSSEKNSPTCGQLSDLYTSTTSTKAA